jgi:hypothetical protein
MKRLLLCLLLAACSSGTSMAGPMKEPAPSVCPPDSVAAPPEPLTWKRRSALVADVNRALELDALTGCRELDQVACGDVHLVALGGNDVEGAAQYEGVARPLATTPLTVDRLVLGACTNRVDLDAAGTPLVFDRLDLSAQALREDDPALRATGEMLFRRLLRRDASAAELDVVSELAVGQSARDFAIAACLAIGTSSENVLY